MNTLWQDIRFAARGFRRRPGFTLVAALTLMLGIGANTAVFALVNAVLIRPLPYPRADQLVTIWGADDTHPRLLLSVPDVEDMRTRSRTLSDIGIARSQSVNLTGGDRPDRVTGEFVSSSTLPLLGATPQIGRLFTAEETTLGKGSRVVVLSHGTWQQRFGGRADILGRSLTLNGNPHTVIGVTAAGFVDPDGSDLWLPITSAPNRAWFDRNTNTVWAYARLREGRTPQDAAVELQAIAKELAPLRSRPEIQNRIAITDLRQSLVGDSRFMLMVLFGSVVAVLLIACVNIANLQLVRASTREREMSVRAALGASRGRLVRQVMIESVLLSLMGGVLGVLFGYWAVNAVVALLPAGLPRTTSGITIDGWVLTFSLVVAVVTGIVFGTPAAFFGTRSDLQQALRARIDRATGGRFSIRNLLVMAELSLCVTLLAVAGLLTQSLIRLQRTNTGFDGAHVLSAEFRLPAAKYDTVTKVVGFMNSALEELRATPGVSSAALVDAVPFSGNFASSDYVAEGQPEPAPGTAPTTPLTSITDGYFATMGIPLVAGRDFAATDRMESEPVAIVSQHFADITWPKQRAVGKTIRFPGAQPYTVRVVGVVADAKQMRVAEVLTPQVYLAKAQQGGIFTSVVMRTSGDPDALANSLREAIWRVDRDQPVWKIRSVQSLVDRDLAASTFSATMIGAFAGLALLLATIGVYGVMSFSVAQRTREMGIRLALGASGGQVRQLVMRAGLETVGLGLTIGILGALGAGRFIRSSLYNVGGNDPLTMAGVPIVLAAVALFACWWPARRAAGVDPAITLRTE